MEPNLKITTLSQFEIRTPNLKAHQMQNPEDLQTLKLDDLWTQARAWADNQGLKHSCYGVQGIAPLCGYYVKFWFDKLGIKYQGLIHLEELEDEEATWVAHYQP